MLVLTESRELRSKGMYCVKEESKPKSRLRPVKNSISTYLLVRNAILFGPFLDPSKGRETLPLP